MNNSSATVSNLPQSQSNEPSLLAGVNVLLEGPPGSGKTYALGTLVSSFPSLECFYIGLESGIESLFAYWEDRKVAPPSNLHWHMLNLLPSGGGGFGKMADTANQIANSTYAALCKIQDMTRGQNNPYERFLRVMNSFDDQRTGKNFGPVDSWGPDRCIILDALTGLGNFIMAMQVGIKPVRDKPDYGVVQEQMERFLRYTCDACKCHFVLLAHIDREVDEVMGGTKITTSAPGQKLGPKLPSLFSDTILTQRQGKVWDWSTAYPMADLKSRNLPVADKISPDFKAIIDKWQARGGKFTPTVKA